MYCMITATLQCLIALELEILFDGVQDFIALLEGFRNCFKVN